MSKYLRSMVCFTLSVSVAEQKRKRQVLLENAELRNTVKTLQVPERASGPMRSPYVRVAFYSRVARLTRLAG